MVKDNIIDIDDMNINQRQAGFKRNRPVCLAGFQSMLFTV